MKTVDRRDFMGYVCALIGCNSLPGVPLPTALSQIRMNNSPSKASPESISSTCCSCGSSACCSSVSSRSSGSWNGGNP